jgi:imidazolonepropionase-like amidohydrolase
LLFPPWRKQTTLLHCGSLIDGLQNQPLSPGTVVVKGNRIVRVDRGYTAPAAGDQVVDLKNKTVMPGLMDMHVHLEGETSKGGAINRFVQNQADLALEGAKHARTTLMAGFTTVATWAAPAPTLPCATPSTGATCPGRASSRRARALPPPAATATLPTATAAT